MSQRIDSHQHFWIFDPVRDSWIDESMQRIQRDFLPEDLFPALEKNQFAGCVAVQADQTETQTHFLLDLAKQNDFMEKKTVFWFLFFLLYSFIFLSFRISWFLKKLVFILLKNFFLLHTLIIHETQNMYYQCIFENSMYFLTIAMYYQCIINVYLKSCIINVFTMYFDPCIINVLSMYF